VRTTTHEDTHLTTVILSDSVLPLAAQTADEQAARGVAADYLSRKAGSTIRRQAADLARFAAFLDQAGEGAGLQLGQALAAFAETVAAFPHGPDSDAEAARAVARDLESKELPLNARPARSALPRMSEEALAVLHELLDSLHQIVLAWVAQLTPIGARLTKHSPVNAHQPVQPEH
jgi:hypothetical protein